MSNVRHTGVLSGNLVRIATLDVEARREADEPATDKEWPSGLPPGRPEDAWADILSAGVSLLEKLSQAVTLKGDTPRKQGDTPALQSLIERDQGTDRNFLRIPVPGTDTLNRIADVLRSLARG